MKEDTKKTNCGLPYLLMSRLEPKKKNLIKTKRNRCSVAYINKHTLAYISNGMRSWDESEIVYYKQ